MGTYAVTGSASGMGWEVAQRLRAAGHKVIGVDLRDSEIVADLSTDGGRRRAVGELLTTSGGVLDGAVLAAGLGPIPGRERLIAQVNYFGVTELLDALRPALARSDRAKVVVIASNSATTTPAVPRRAVRAFLAGDGEKALRAVRFYGRASAAMIYAASKIAVARWVRRQAVRPDWAGAGIRLNAVAPGAVMTPLLAEQLADPKEAKAVKSFPVPVGGYGDAGHLADWMMFMLSDAADFLCGSVVFVDGGSDAYFRAESWPAPVPARSLPRYLLRFLSYPRSGG
ncbi:NAD-dependent epimerase [Mycobacterium sp. 852013-50091_SCH5140682]|uniref:SDR family oxidoreductase n=1 Tax=Mycobacterium sp. 852013-50091_SCH5140682 TaxID=1834109 RepID=UPI0007EA21BF|nr:SDR family oxidoreductase [Mycobacterium sp. 852013-50091_SCH5140682]OBB98814.1 NAD-dependent epimerase [Mycobacterium sp. 852013-50091_SCH5140682]